MVKRLFFGMSIMLFIQTYAMDVLQVKVEPLGTILEKLRSDEKEYLRLKYVSLAKAYAAEASEALRLYIIELYDGTDEAEQKRYDGILQEKLKKGIDALRQEVASPLEGESFAHDTNRWLEKIRVDALVRMIQNYSEDKNPEISRLYKGLTFHDYKKRAQEHLERLHRSNPTLQKLISLIESNNPSASAILEEMRRLKAEQKDPLDGASFMLLALLGLSEKDLETKRLGVGLGYSSPALQKASGTQIFVNSKERGRGGIVFNQQEVAFSGFIRRHLEQGRGTSAADAIVVPLTRDELQKIRDYIKLIIGGIEGFDYEVLDQLSLEELATAMRQASDLQIEVLLDLVQRKFVERIKERDAKYFDATYALLQTFDFSSEVQKGLSGLLFTSDQRKALLSLLHSRFKCDNARAIVKPGPLGYVLATESSAVEFWHPPSHKQFWGVFEHADHKRLWRKEFDSPIVTTAWLQAPFLLVCTEKALHIIDVISDRCLKTMSAEDCGCSGSFWACPPSLDEMMIALGCGEAIVFVKVQTGELYSKLERTGVQDGYYFTGKSESTIFPEQGLFKNTVLVRAITATKNKISFWDNLGVEISSIEIAETVLGIDTQGEKAIIHLKNGCALLNLLAEDSRVIIREGTYKKVVFSYDGKVAIFLRDDGALEIRDTSDWQVITIIPAYASDFFLSTDNQHIMTLHANELRMWHYFDDRLGYINEPMSMLQAHLFAQATAVLQEDQNCISRIETPLLKGTESGIRALEKLVLQEDAYVAGPPVADSTPMQPVDNNAVSAARLYAQALEHLAALHYKEAMELLMGIVSLSDSKELRPDAYFKLGELHRDGKGVDKNATLAFEYFRKAIE